MEFNFSDFNDFCNKNNLSKEEGIKLVLENINKLSDELEKLRSG